MQSRLALRERHRRARTGHSADPGGSHIFEVLQQRAEQLRRASVPAGPCSRRPNDQSVRTCALVRHALTSLGSRQPFVSRQRLVHIFVLTGGLDATEKEKKVDSRCIVSLGFRMCSCWRQRTGTRPSLSTDPEQRQTWRRCQTVLTAFSAARHYLCALPVRRSPSQSTVQDGLASFARHCRHRMRDPADSRNRRLFSVQRVRTSQLRRAPHGAPVPCRYWSH